MQLLYFAKAALTVWMLIDAARRRADFYWYLVIFLPFGAIVYFFVVKIHDYDLKTLKKSILLDHPPPIDQLRRRVSEAPSAENKILLGQRLFDTKEYQEAATLFGEVLDRDKTDKDALYGMGLCKINLKAYQEAPKFLAALIEQDPAFSNYEPWFDLAFAFWQQDDRKRATAILSRLVELSPRIKHKAILGKYYSRSGETEEARRILNEALDDYQEANSFVKRTSGKWAIEARKTLNKLKS